ncbi:hypothetical protein HPB52_007304 [Rhipicephalus sanguineus]|uniref:Uncharacterized protein n=1 Tax=Rhipicephalus sanguineus TaxID=34632 RepID=A0A9D4Q578_RHISA|nr:hypothetical protein HPB52_007304 [Rhipicephalus sanguineus]
MDGVQEAYSQIGLPQKILIPERYIEVESENVSAVEQLRRSLKAANIRKMLTETVGYEDLGARGSVEALRSKVKYIFKITLTSALALRMQKEGGSLCSKCAYVRTSTPLLSALLLLSFWSRSSSSMAGRFTWWRAVMATLERLDPEVLRQEALQREREEQDSSPEQPLPLYQQRENYLT